MHWYSPAWVKTLRNLVKNRFGDAHQTWKEIVAAKVVTICRTCGDEFDNVFTSRTDYEAFAKGHKRLDECPACTQARLLQAREQRCQASEAERARLEALRAMPYDEYLQTEHWQSVRKNALKRARYKCQACNSSGELHVHHKTYDHLGQEWPSDLLVVCADCHAKIHNKEPRNG